MLALEAGLSDLQMVTVAALRSGYAHQNPKMNSCRNYKYVGRNNFEKEMKNTLIAQKISHKDLKNF